VPKAKGIVGIKGREVAPIGAAREGEDVFQNPTGRYLQKICRANYAMVFDLHG
jgi:hypothetical protein